MLLAHSFVFLLSYLLITTLAKPNDVKAEQETYYTTEDRQAMIYVVRYNNKIAKCHIFGGREVINDIIQGLDEQPIVVTDDQLATLRTECRPVQQQQIQDQLDNIKKVTDDIQNSKQDIQGDHLRRKRHIKMGSELLSGIYPGTLWCGLGNIADKVKTDDGLGENKKLDACCRAHDKCNLSICGFCTRKDLNLRNNVPWARSACDCDSEFKECLKSANDHDANTIGKLYYNTLDIDCIEYNHPLICVKRSWWGSCRKFKRDTDKPKKYMFYDQPGY